MSRLALFLLGPPRIERDGTQVHLDRRKAVALVAYLAVTGQRHRRETLATLLWPEHDQTRALANLRRTLAAIKKAVGEEALDTDREHVGLCQGTNLSVDVHRFRDLAESFRAHIHGPGRLCPTCLDSLSSALAVYQGDFMAGFTLRGCPDFDDWQSLQSEHFRQEFGKTLERLVEGHTARADFQTAIPYARRWVSADPLHEPAHRTLMQLYAWMGQTAAALQQYRACARVLQKELDALPSEETTWLHQAIREGRCPPAPSAPSASPSNLPPQSTPFIGRERELTGIAQRLANPDCRLLTLVGPGGMGKTRLALEAAARQVQRFVHGVHYIPLVSTSAPQLIVTAVADALGFLFDTHSGDTGGEALGSDDDRHKEQLLNYLREKEMLLVLDNFEHLVGGADLLVDMLSAAPRVRLLVTSRERLNLRAEWLVEVAGMAFPEAETPDAQGQAGDYDAVQLFEASARRSNPGFTPGKQEQTAAILTCRLLGGMPLGIELSAAWARTLSCAEIAQEVERATRGSNLDFLAAPMRDVPKRHRSLRAVFEHSWNLLSAQEQSTLSGLTVFRGGFDRKAAEQVAGASLAALSALVDKSLLQASLAGSGERRTRYDMHELLRQYAGEKLESKAQIQDRHCAYYAQFLRQRKEPLHGKGQKQAIEDIEREIENVRAAWQWAVSRGNRQAIDQGLDSLYTFYTIRGPHVEGRETFERAATMLAGDDWSQVQDTATARVLARLGRFLDRAYRLTEAHALYEKSLAAFDRFDAREERAFVLTYMAGMAHWERRSDEARALYQESLAIAQEAGNQDLEALALGGLATIAYDLYESDEAEALYQQNLAIRRAMGAPLGIASALIGTSIGAARLGRHEQADRLIEESLAIRREMGDRRGMVSCFYQLAERARCEYDYAEAKRWHYRCLDTLHDLGDLTGTLGVLSRLEDMMTFLGEHEQAAQVGEQIMDIAQQVDNPQWMAFALQGLGQTAHKEGDYARARQLYGQSLDIGRETAHQRIITWSLSGLGDTAYAAGQYGEARTLYQESMEQCQGRENQDIVPDIQVRLGKATCALGEHGESRAYFWQALSTAVESGHIPFMLDVLSETALLHAKEGRLEQAVEVLTLVLHHPLIWHETKERAARLLDELLAELPAEAAAAAQERGKAASLEAMCRTTLDDLVTKHS
jgi:predicted ATPase/DNA-binding SARP family transcriptional activator